MPHLDRRGNSLKLSDVIALLIALGLLPSCSRAKAVCVAGEPSRQVLLERAAESIFVRSARRHEPNGFGPEAIRPGCCSVTRKSASITDRSTYHVSIYWWDERRRTSHGLEQKLDECGGVLDERGY